MPSCFFAAMSVRTKAEDPVGVLAERGPGLLAVDDVVVAVALRRGLERGEVGAGAGLGEALAPPVVEIGDARQEAALLLLRAEGDDHRPDHADAERQRRGRRRLLHLVLEDVLLHRVPAGAAPFDRPVRHRPALGVEDARPVDELVLRGVVAHRRACRGCASGSAVRKKARTSSRKAVSSGVKRRSMRGSFSFSVVIPDAAKRRARDPCPRAGAMDPGCAASLPG